MPFRFTTAGESHGPGLTAVIEGLPAGLELTPQDIDADLARRQLGHGRGGRMKIEKDRAEVTSGVRHGRTLGGPIALRMANRDYANWEERMNPWPVEGDVEEVHLPRPGHADLAGVQKFGFTDVRNVLERASARETTSRVAVGALAKVYLRAFGVEIRSHVTRIGSVTAPERDTPGAGGLRGRSTSPRCAASTRRRRRRWWTRSTPPGRPTSRSAGSTRSIAFGLVPGIGSHLSWDDRLDGRLAHGDHVDPGDEGRRHRRRVRPGRPRGLGGPRRDLLLRGAGLLPRDQPRRRRWRAA